MGIKVYRPTSSGRRGMSVNTRDFRRRGKSEPQQGAGRAQD